MHMFVKSAALATLLLSTRVDSFGTPMQHRVNVFGTTAGRHGTSRSTTRTPSILNQPPAALQLSSSSPSSTTTSLYASPTDDDDNNSEVERLRSMAAKLRAEASALEAEKAQQRADAVQRAFAKFDTDSSGAITLPELKQGLEKILKTELKEERVEKLMSDLDASGDGALQLDEFVSVDQFRARLEAIVRDEQAAAKAAAKQAQQEQEMAALAQAKMQLLNDKAPSPTDKIISVLPYLLPLMDGLQFGRFLLDGQDNPAVAVLALLFALYRSIPFGGFVAFLALNVLSGNLGINRLIRFNSQQAIYLDIALFFPGLIASLYTLVLNGAGVNIDPSMTALFNDAIFVTLLAAIGYSVSSSLLGFTPDKIPGVSDYVNQRMPTIDMLDDNGRYIFPDQKENDSAEDKDDKKK